MVYRIFYASLPSPDLHWSADFDILRTSWDRNNALDLTGVLLRIENRYFQWLEGPKDAVQGVMQSITEDVRHSDIQILREGRTGVRRFSKWFMAAEDLPKGDTGRLLQRCPLCKDAADFVVRMMDTHAKGRARPDLLRKPLD